ncbi:hypothetical protein NDU88_005321 [Pleurodeles waltl]|uniref:Secreted protein n=1 Tax=Pleurodeles waltl TaxID=8319 RepID=A0AAV7V6A9_PLEWA|nr:hypothetical protein NDU88_005321 [Pleurodeles waltl]
MLLGRPRGDPLSQLLLLFQVLYPVFAPRRSSEAAAILVPPDHQRDMLFSPQPLFFVHRCLHHNSQVDFRSVERILPLVFGAWRCYYFGCAPFVAPERRARRAASSAEGHASGASI